MLDRALQKMEDEEVNQDDEETEIWVESIA
jgi:hypothetical protein